MSKDKIGTGGAGGSIDDSDADGDNYKDMLAAVRALESATGTAASLIGLDNKVSDAHELENALVIASDAIEYLTNKQG